VSQGYGRVLAVDFGERRTGLAATDYTGRILVPLPRIDHRTVDECLAEVVATARDRSTEIAVVGLPLSTSGEIGPRARRTLEFVERLRTELAPCGIEVVTVDETATTDEAHARLKQAGMKAAQRKKLADSLAALVILERHLGLS
jgi:putative Holliday junction resolvase